MSSGLPDFEVQARELRQELHGQVGSQKLLQDVQLLRRHLRKQAESIENSQENTTKAANTIRKAYRLNGLGPRGLAFTRPCLPSPLPDSESSFRGPEKLQNAFSAAERASFEAVRASNLGFRGAIITYDIPRSIAFTWCSFISTQKSSLLISNIQNT